MPRDPDRDREEANNNNSDRCKHEHAEPAGTCSEGCCDRYHCLDRGKYLLMEVGD